MDIFQDEYSGIADEEQLEHYLEISSNEANDTLIDICTGIESDIFAVQSYFEIIIENIKELLVKIRLISGQAINPQIDNT